MSDENKKTSANRLAKEVIVEEIKTKLDEASSIVLTDYQGLTHKQIEEFKKQLKTAGATFAITKNTLLKISLSTSKNFADKVNDEALNAPTATLFISGDPIEALKILQKLAKDTGLPKIKVGVVDGSVLDQAQIVKLSTLPNKATLIAQFVGLLNSPIQGLVVVLNGNIQKLAIVLNAIAQSKPVASAPAPVAPAASEPQAEAPAPTEAVVEPQAEAPTSEAAPQEAQAEAADEDVTQESAPAAEETPVETVSEEPASQDDSNNSNSEGGENS